MIYEYWLATIRHLSDQKKIYLRKQIGTGKELYYIEERRLQKHTYLTQRDIMAIREARKNINLEKDYEVLEKKNLRFIPFYSDEYPDKLKEIASPPYALYVRGHLPNPDKKAVAIVGARSCTRYGEKYAMEYGEKLAQNGVQIISGMARGIDGAGQRGAINGGGYTCAVLGSGPDICYPKENKGLYLDILERKGGILSEFAPGTVPIPSNFPRRNRIISAFSDVVLVMEARLKSGSLITADMALEQGKDVYALPGPVDSVLSQGCNKLIFQGAGILLSPKSLLEELGVITHIMQEKTCKNIKELETTEDMVYSRLDLFPKSMANLLEETNLSADKLMETLVSLEIKGYIKEVSKNYYIKQK